MLANRIQNENSPIPAYGTTRYNGANDFKENINKCFTKSPRNAYNGIMPLCTKRDKWSKKSRDKRMIETESVCKNSTESSVVSICGGVSKESNHCTCKDKLSCTCLENKQRKSNTSSTVSSICCMDWKEMYKFTDTSDMKLVDSFEKLINCVQNDGDVNIYLDLYEPQPREERIIKCKDLPPSGYDVTLILPQCVCLTNHRESKKIRNSESDETICDDKSKTISELICVPSIPELSWDIMQSGMIERIPEKYTTNIFENKKDELVCTNVLCSGIGKNMCKETNSHATYCLHKAFMEKLNESYFSI